MKFRMMSPDDVMYNILKTNLHNYNKLLKLSIKRSKKHYYHSCFKKIKSDMKKTWVTVNKILNKTINKKKFPDQFRIDEEVITDKVTIANKFKVFFTKSSTQYRGSC